MLWDGAAPVPMGLSDEAPHPGALHLQPGTSSRLPCGPRCFQSLLLLSLPLLFSSRYQPNPLLSTIPASCASTLSLGLCMPFCLGIYFLERLSHIDICSCSRCQGLLPEGPDQTSRLPSCPIVVSQQTQASVCSYWALGSDDCGHGTSLTSTATPGGGTDEDCK